MRRTFILFAFLFLCSWGGYAQWNTNNILRMGQNAIYFDDYISAIDNFNNIIRVKPYLSEPYFFRGLAKLNLDDYEGAIQDYSKAIELNPNYFHAYMYRGVAWHNLRKYEEAMARLCSGDRFRAQGCLCVCQPGGLPKLKWGILRLLKRLLESVDDR